MLSSMPINSAKKTRHFYWWLPLHRTEYIFLSRRNWIYAVIYIQQNRLVLANKLLQILYNTDKYWPNMVILSDLWKISWCLPFSPSAFFTGQTEKDWFGQNQYLPFKFDKCVGYVKMGSRNMRYHVEKKAKHVFQGKW